MKLSMKTVLVMLLASCQAKLIIRQDFADPGVIVVDGVTHVFATEHYGKNIQHATSMDRQTWSQHPDSLPHLGSWAKPGRTWAPYVFAVDDHYVMWYTAWDVRSDAQCIGVAKSDSLDAVFVDESSEALVCDPESRDRAIDAFMIEEDGQRFIVYRAIYEKLGLYIQQVNHAADRLIGPAISLIQVDREWEHGVNEAPTLIKHNNKYYLFFSASTTWDFGYFTSYAVADNVTGPYVKSGRKIMSTDHFGGQVRGPGGEDVILGSDGQWYIFYHGWDKNTTMRMLHVSSLDWDSEGQPFVRKD